MAGKSFVFRFADVEVREREFSLTKAGERLAVEPKAFRVLLILLRNPGKLIPKQELLDAVWGDAAVTENSLARAVALLRKVLGDEARTPRFIETVATVGYRFVGTLQAVEDPTAVSVAPDAKSASEGRAATPIAAGETKSALRTARKWAVSGGVALLLLAAGFWYLTHPLPAPRITVYTQLTHDGKIKELAGTDGSRLYLNFDTPSRMAQLSVEGGEPAPVSISIPGIYSGITDISADGSNALLLAAEPGDVSHSIWIAPVLGGAARRLDDGYSAAFSPDGGSAIYSTNAGEIRLIHTDGTGKRKLASVAAVAAGSAAFSFAWSPDRASIRFAAQDGKLWEMASDGSGVHLLFPEWKEHSGQCCGRWTKDGSFYLFIAGGEIWALDERRGLLRRPSPVPLQLTNGLTGWGTLIPGGDGKTVFVEGRRSMGELWRIDLKTGTPRPFLGGVSAQDISFSPDGKSIAYVAFPEGTLWKSDRDGANRVRLTRPPDIAGNPRWSPNSREIVYGVLHPDATTTIRRISAVDGAQLWLLDGDSTRMHDPTWSADGAQVLFGTGPITSAARERQDLRIVDLRTRQITIVQGSEGKWSPRWSSDGRYIAAFPGVGIETKLLVLDIATHQWRLIPTNGEMDYLSFSHDNRFIYFIRHGRDQGVFRVPVTGGREERVADLTDWHITGFFGFSMSLDPTDAPLVLRDTGTDDIYALTLEQ